MVLMGIIQKEWFALKMSQESTRHPEEFLSAAAVKP